MRGADYDGTTIGEQIIDSVRNGNANGIRSEIVIVDQARGQIPTRAGVFEITDQFALLGIDADDGMTLALESIAKLAKIEELIVTIGTVAGGEFLTIDAQRIAHLMKEPGDGIGADDDTEVAQRQGNLGSGSPRPLHPGDGIASGVVFEQIFDQRDDVGGFFPPACGRRRNGGSVLA